MHRSGLIIYFLVLSFLHVFSQNENKIDSTTSGTSFNINVDSDITKLDSVWKFNLMDDPKFLTQDYDDSQWLEIHTLLGEKGIKKSKFTCFGIFRMHLKLDSVDNTIPKVLFVEQSGASEVYVNGKLLKSYGIVSCNKDIEKRESIQYEGIYLPQSSNGEYIIAVRYSNTDSQSRNANGVIEAGFRMHLENSVDYNEGILEDMSDKAILGLSFFMFFATIGLLHFLLFIFYSVRRSNLYFAIFCFVLSYYFLFFYLYGSAITNSEGLNLLKSFAFVTAPLFFTSLLSVLYSFFYEKFPKLFYYALTYCAIAVIVVLCNTIIGSTLSFFLIVFSTVESIRIIIVAVRKKKTGAMLITFGFGIFLLLFVFAILKLFFSDGINLAGESFSEKVLLFSLSAGIIAMPLSMSIFLAWDFSLTNKTLSRKLVEVEELSAKSIEQEKEKQKILAEQNEMLEVQVEERTKEISEQKKVIEEKNKDITDSINYAQRIQRSILPTEGEIKDIFNDCFVLFKPRDIVSGDFYQFKKSGDYKYAILADCTGHGVPGALMSMVGSNLLKQIIIERGVKEPNKILSELHKEVRSTLRQTGGVQSHDGMDAAIVLFHNKKLFISSANRPVYIVKKGVLTELKPDKRSIGGSQASDEIEFSINELEVDSGMTIYLFSDGYADQFGGEAGKKFKVKNLSNLLVSISAKPLETQKEILNTTFDNWKKHLEQVDDVSLIGIKF